MMNLKTIVAEAAVAGALGFTALGLGAGVANAAPPSPVAAGIPWQQDEGHGDHGDWNWGDHGDWGNRGDWGNHGDWGNRGDWGPHWWWGWGW
jgi:hypothetical protein